MDTITSEEPFQWGRKEVEDDNSNHNIDNNDDNNDDFMIPVIDLENPDIEQLRQACMEVGFFYLKGHGLEESFLEKIVLEETQKLFALPLASKQALMDPVTSRGYTGMEEETLDPANQRTRGDTKEGFYIGREVSVDHPDYNPAQLTGPNYWPSKETTPEMQHPERFRAVMEEYFHRLCQVGLETVRMLALALKCPHRNALDAHFENKPMAALRLLHYAAVPSQPDQGIFACGAHSDYGMLTLLYTDDQPGLQIWGIDRKSRNHNNTKIEQQKQQTESKTIDDDGTRKCWISVPKKQGHFIVNLGDMLERWSNGLFRSTRHRVVTTSDTQERYSMAFFYEPAFETNVECLPSCCCSSRPAHYPPVISGEYLLAKYRQTHADFTPETGKHDNDDNDDDGDGDDAN